jgi:hypothetical protein
MSNVFTSIISGTGVFAVPTDDASLAAAEAALESLISGVPNLTYSKVFAWVKDGDAPGGTRTLNALISGALYNGATCPSAADTQIMLAAIEAALVASPNISSVSVQESNIVDESNGGVLPGITNTIFVAKGSNTIEDGSFNFPFHTYGAAITEAISRSPTQANQQTIWGYPGRYVESFTVPSWVNIFAPGACIVGNILLGDNVDMVVKELEASSGIGILKPLGSSGTARFQAEVVRLTSNALGAVNLSLGAGSVLMYEVKQTYVENGIGIGDITTDVGHMHLMCEDIYITGTGIGISRTGLGTTEGYAAHILEIGGGVGVGTAVSVQSGDIDLFVHRIVANTALNVGAAGTLRLFASVITGAQIVAGTLKTAIPV